MYCISSSASEGCCAFRMGTRRSPSVVSCIARLVVALCFVMTVPNGRHSNVALALGCVCRKVPLENGLLGPSRPMYPLFAVSLCFLWEVPQSPVVTSVMAALTRTVPLVVGLIFLLQPAQLYVVGLVVVSLGAAVASSVDMFVVLVVWRCALCLLGTCVRARASRVART